MDADNIRNNQGPPEQAPRFMALANQGSPNPAPVTAQAAPITGHLQGAPKAAPVPASLPPKSK